MDEEDENLLVVQTNNGVETLRLKELMEFEKYSPLDVSARYISSYPIASPVRLGELVKVMKIGNSYTLNGFRHVVVDGITTITGKEN